jgi:ribosomal protein L19E
MSDKTEAAQATPLIWRVKKAPDGDIYGPVDEATLKEWAAAAQISPEDLIDLSDNDWRPAPEIVFLEMVWVVKLPGEELYGPTSVGTLREFIEEGLISDKSIATNVNTTQSLPVGALLAALDFEKKRAARRTPSNANKSTLNINLDRAKDQRIRQLEEDLRSVRKDHDALVHKYRQLSLEIKSGVTPVPVPVAVVVPKIVSQPQNPPPSTPSNAKMKTGRFWDR